MIDKSHVAELRKEHGKMLHVGKYRNCSEFCSRVPELLDTLDALFAVAEAAEHAHRCLTASDNCDSGCLDHLRRSLDALHAKEKETK